MGTILYLCFRILWVFTFVELCIVAFLMLLHNGEMAELKKRILPGRSAVPSAMNPGNAEGNIVELSEGLANEARELQRSRIEIKNVENVLNDVGNKTLSCRDRYRSIMMALKKDVRKTEIEMKALQDHAYRLSLRREELKNEILKQGQEYQRMIDDIAKDFGNKEAITLTSCTL